MRIRELNDIGTELFRAFLAQVRAGTSNVSTLQTLQIDNRYSEPSAIDMDVDFQTFESRAELAEYMARRFESAGVDELPYSPGLWTWLAVFYFGAITPMRPSGSVAVREDARYIYTPTYNRDYRHRIAGPTRTYWNFRDNPSAAALLLSGRPFELSDFEEQLMSRLGRIQNTSLIEAANHLYFDTASGRPKRGAQRGRPGSLRRLLRVFKQYERTYDLYSMDAGQIVGLLPEEFGAWSRA